MRYLFMSSGSMCVWLGHIWNAILCYVTSLEQCTSIPAHWRVFEWIQMFEDWTVFFFRYQMPCCSDLHLMLKPCSGGISPIPWWFFTFCRKKFVSGNLPIAIWFLTAILRQLLLWTGSLQVFPLLVSLCCLCSSVSQTVLAYSQWLHQY